MMRVTVKLKDCPIGEPYAVVPSELSDEAMTEIMNRILADHVPPTDWMLDISVEVSAYRTLVRKKGA